MVLASRHEVERPRGLSKRIECSLRLARERR